MRSLLRTFVGLGAAIALVGAAIRSGRAVWLALAATALFAALLALSRRLGARRAGYLCTASYFALIGAAMLSGRGAFDLALVLVPAGMLLGALLLDRDHRLPLIVLAVAGVAAIGLAGLDWQAPSRLLLARLGGIVLVTLLLLVAGVLTRKLLHHLESLGSAERRAASELERSRSELETRTEALHLVNSLANRLHRNLEVEAVARETVDALIRLSHPPLVAFYLLAEDGSHLRLAADHGFTPEERERGATLPLEGSLSGLAVRERRLVTSEDLGADARAAGAIRAPLGERGARAVLCIPLVFGDRALGTVNLIYLGPHRFSAADLEAFRAIGQAVALALANARHVEGLAHQAFHDALTGLPNRASLHRRIAGHHEEGGDGRIGLALIDLNGFREINEAVGHPVGDQILVEFGSRLARHAPEAEAFRLGADEFVLLAPGVAGAEEAERRAQAALATLAEPFAVDGMAIEIGASAGVALFPDHGRNGQELLRCADVAMHRAKREAGGVAAYRRELDQHTAEKLALRGELSRAIRSGALALHFQPQVALGSGGVVGFEALLRWPHPRLGLLLPAAFLPAAESSDVVHPLTYWTVEGALAQLARWHRTRPDLTMAINLSVRILMDRNCSQRLEEIMRRAGVDPGRVEFELTETAILTDPATVSAMLRRITSTGARLAIDDFGTGYSSLAYLQRFPVDTIKIDRSFVGDMAADGQSRAIVRSTLQLARSLGIGVVAEGVEDQPTADLLREMGCEVAQGFLFARPAPAEEVGPVLAVPRPFASPPS